MPSRFGGKKERLNQVKAAGSVAAAELAPTPDPSKVPTRRLSVDLPEPDYLAFKDLRDRLNVDGVEVMRWLWANRPDDETIAAGLGRVLTDDG